MGRGGGGGGAPRPPPPRPAFTGTLNNGSHNDHQHLLPIDLTEGDVNARGGEGSAFHVAALIVEEDVRL